MTVCRLLTVGVLAVLLGLASAAGQPPPDPKITQILRDWNARLERFQSVRYTVSGTTEKVNTLERPPNDPDAARIVPDPPGPKEKPLKATIFLDLANKRFRVEETTLVPSRERDRWVPRFQVSAFDGKTFQRGTPPSQNKELGPQNPDINISKGNLETLQFAEKYWPVFLAHGIVPTAGAPLRPDRWPTEYDPEEFVLGGTVSHAGRQCVVLKTNPTSGAPNLLDELWVDLGRQGAILRYTNWQVQSKNPWFRLDIEYTHSPNGWLPAKWTETASIAGKVMSIHRLNVVSVEVNPPVREEDLSIPIEPGMTVNTYEYPERGKGLRTGDPARGKYRVSPDGDFEPLEPPTGFTTVEGVQLPPETGRWRWVWWAVGGAAMVAVLVLGFQRWRHRRVMQQPG